MKRRIKRINHRSKRILGTQYLKYHTPSDSPKELQRIQEFLEDCEHFEIVLSLEQRKRLADRSQVEIFHCKPYLPSQKIQDDKAALIAQSESLSFDTAHISDRDHLALFEKM